MVTIKRMIKEEIPEAAKIGELSFSGLRPYQKALEWITSNFNAAPRTSYYGVYANGRLVGYILWLEKGGFRENAVLELEQICVHPDYRGKGFARQLITESLRDRLDHLKSRGSTLKLIEVTTGTENEAQNLYRKTMGAEVVAIIPNLFRSDEAIMIARYEEVAKRI
jgi:ribosomal protein S18 acetylase RimI-like enzyme